jgi:cell division protein FtsZ
MEITGGLGAGSFPEKGQAAAEENAEDIRKFLAGADMVFITAGMGGGTGTGASPIVAKIAKEMGALTVAVVTTPLPFEGTQRMAQALKGIQFLKPAVDSLIVISNEKLMELNKKLSFNDFFALADDILANGVKSITEIILNPGFINRDFNDITTVMKDKGYAHMGVGRGKGEGRIDEAVRGAVDNPLLEIPLSGAKSMLVNITANRDESAAIMEDVMLEINKYADPNARTLLGLVLSDEVAEDEVIVTVIATELSTKDNPDTKLPPDGIPIKTSVGGAVPPQTEYSDEYKKFFEEILPADEARDNAEDGANAVVGATAEASTFTNDTGRVGGIDPTAAWPINPDNPSSGPFEIPDFLNNTAQPE